MREAGNLVDPCGQIEVMDTKMFDNHRNSRQYDAIQPPQ
jgi:hypothetical protein